MSAYDKTVQTITSPTSLNSVPNTEYFIFCNAQNTNPVYNLEAGYRLTTALLHLDGADGSTTITDNSFIASASWTGTLSTTQKKFGTASFWQTSTRVLRTTLAADQIPMPADFTFELWFFPTSNGAGGTIASWNPQDGAGSPTARFLIYFNSGNVVQYLRFNDTVGTNSVTSTATLALNTWHHIAVSRKSNFTKLFINGNDQGGFSDTLNYTQSANFPLIGANQAWHGALQGLQPGYYDELRITRGFARYTSSFSPPTTAFPDSSLSLSSAGNVFGTPTLPTAIGNSCVYHVKNINSLNEISVLTSSNQTIEGTVTSWSLRPFESISLISDGTGWRIF